MSFLLDALGKADDDRRRDAVPELRTRGHRRNTPTRSLLRIVLLVLFGLISFSLGFFSRPYLEPGYTISIVRDGEKAAVSASPKTSVASASVQNQIGSPDGTQALPVTAQEIELSVISYSSEPTERFAMLNGFLMYEGDILSAGERLIEIRPDGVLLEKDGRQYKLSLAIAPRH